MKKTNPLLRVSLIGLTGVLFLGLTARQSALLAAQEKHRGSVAGIPPFSYFEVIERRNFFRPQDTQKTSSRETFETVRNGIGSGPEGYGAQRTSLGFSVTGIVKIKNRYKAIVEKIDADKGYYISSGDMLEEFLVTNITADSVTLESNTGIHKLKLKKIEKRAPAPQKAPEEIKPDKATESQAQYPEHIMQRLRRGQGGRP